MINFGGGISQTFSKRHIMSAGFVSKFSLKYCALNGCGPPEKKKYKSIRIIFRNLEIQWSRKNLWVRQLYVALSSTVSGKFALNLFYFRNDLPPCEPIQHPKD
jgi:hypothetical protein